MFSVRRLSQISDQVNPVGTSEDGTTGLVVPQKTSQAGASQSGLQSIKVAVFSVHKYVEDSMVVPLQKVCPNVVVIPHNLGEQTAPLAKGCQVVDIFVNDVCDAKVINILAAGGTKLIALRCAGFDRVDLDYAYSKGMKVVRVPVYSPTSVAEHAVALVMSLNRNIHLTYNRVKNLNYTLSGLVGFEVFGKTVGIFGTGAIGMCSIRIFKGFGCNILAFDVVKNQEAIKMGVKYCDPDEIFQNSDIISLHCPLLKSTKHLINDTSISKMKKGVIIVNTSRGGLIDTQAVIRGLDKDIIGGIGTDVYEHEGEIFFKDLSQFTGSTGSNTQAYNRELEVLKSFPNVIVTPHSAFLTKEALFNISRTTIENITTWANGEPLKNEQKPMK